METMFPGTDHEMINMYHLDGEDLVLTHYCSQGNQPQMRLDRAASSADRLVFEFAGGTNLDPGSDMHIHASRRAPPKLGFGRSVCTRGHLSRRGSHRSSRDGVVWAPQVGDQINLPPSP